MAVVRKRLPLAATSTAKNEVVNESSPQNTCPPAPNKTAAECQQPLSAVLILIATFCVMLFLIAIANLLIFYCYYKHRRADSPDRAEHIPGTAAAATNIEVEGVVGPCLLLPEYSQTSFLVIMPGDEEPGFFARPSSLPNSTGRASGVTESESIECRNDHATEVSACISTNRYRRESG